MTLQYKDEDKKSCHNTMLSTKSDCRSQYIWRRYTQHISNC